MMNASLKFPSPATPPLRLGAARGPGALRRCLAAVALLLLAVAFAGHSAASTGGPDAFGYRFIDSAEPGGPAYDFVDISTTGTLAASVSGSDDNGELVPIGFTFSHYGTPFTNCGISSNGFLSLGSVSGSLDISSIPSANALNDVIAGFWHDLDPGSGGNIYYQTIGSAPNRVFLVQFQDVQEYGNLTVLNTFQFKLFETSGNIEIHYQTIGNALGTTALIGIENGDGSVGLEYFKGPALPPIGAGPFAVRFFLATTVANTNDSGAGSLRQAILDTASGGTINFAPGLDGGSILLTMGQLTLNKNLDIDASALPSGITVNGSGNTNSRVIAVNAGNTVLLKRLTVTGGTIRGIDNRGFLTMVDCEITGNSSPGHGGGIYHETGTLLMINGAIVNNTAGATSVGGGLAALSGTAVELRNVTVAGNVGGAPGSTGGGGIYSQSVALTLNHVTIAANTSRSDSGGLRISSGSLHLENTIIAGNSAATFTPDLGSSPTTRAGINFIGSTSGSGLGTLGVDYLTGDPMLGSLAENGGPTRSMLPLEGSPVVDPAGAATSSALATDQRGYARVSDGNNPPDGTARVDIGAVELGAVRLVANTSASGAGSLRQAILDLQPGEKIALSASLGGQTISVVPDGELAISGKAVRLDASGLTGGLTISGGNSSRIFSVGTGASLDLVGITLKDGRPSVAPNGFGGGAILNTGDVTLERCTLSNHYVDNGFDGLGGAISNFSPGNLALTQCTLANNHSRNFGGAIFNNSSGTMALTHCTISANTTGNGGGLSTGTGTTVLTNCIVAGNTAPSGGPDIYKASGTLTTAGFNFIGTTAGSGLAAGGTISTGNAMLSALGDFGGPLQTMRLLPGSQAINAASVTGLTTDQRGFPRLAGGAVDLGAVEEQVIGMGPSSGTTNTSMRQSLNWSGAPGVTFEVFVGTNPGSLALQGTGPSPFSPTLTNFGTAHYWRVDALSNGLRAPGPVASFSTRAKHLIVNTALDENNGFAVGGVSLRDALNEVVTVPALESITFAGALDGGTITLGGTALAVNQSVIIDASGLSGGLVVSGALLSRVFDIGAAAIVEMDHLTITRGRSPSNNGAGIRNSGDLTIRRSTIRDNSASIGGGIYSSGRLRLDDCTIEANVGSFQGGGLFQDGNSLACTGCTFSGNTTPNNGGAMYISSAGICSLVNCTVSGNASLAGGGGGGIMTYAAAQLHLVHTTVANNSAPSSGGGIIKGLGDVYISLENSIVAGNSAGSGPDLSGAVNSHTGKNFIGNTSGASGLGSLGSDYLTGNPRLGALAANGGPTKTMPLLTGSPAIDAAVNAALPTDQRGFERVLGAAPDIGAYEASAGNFSLTGLTIYAQMDAALTGSGVNFEISTDPSFEPTTGALAGTGAAGFADAQREAAQFNFPSGVAEDTLGNLFVADTANHRIRMIAPGGAVSTIAGTGSYGFADGPGNTARFAFPAAVTVGPNNHVYVSDTLNHRIRKLTRPAVAGQPWTVTTFAGDGGQGFLDGTGSVAQFNHPHGLIFDGADLLVADSTNERIRKITPAGQVSTRFYNGGFLNFPTGLARDTGGNLFVADPEINAIWKIAPGTTDIDLFAGGSQGNVTSSNFNRPVGLAIDATGNLYVADENNHAIRKITPAGAVSTVAGDGIAGDDDGLGTTSRFRCPQGVLINSKGQLIVADTQNHRIRRVLVKPITVAAVVAPGGEDVSREIDIEELGLASDTTYYVRWRALTPGMETQEFGQSFYLPLAPAVVTDDPAGPLTSTSAQLNGTVDPNNSPADVWFEFSTDPELQGPWEVGSLLGLGAFTNPRGVAYVGTDAYVVTGNRIFQVSPGGAVTFIAGSDTGFADGAGAAAQFDGAAGIAADAAGNLYVADEFNQRIRKVTRPPVEGQAWMVSTLAGSGLAGFADGAGGTARFLFPQGIAVDAAGNTVYVADAGNHRIRKISGGNVTTLAGGSAGFADGSGSSARFRSPQALALGAGGQLAVADTGNHSVRLVTAGGGVVTVAGSGVEGYLDGAGATAQFSSPSGIASAAGGWIYVTDPGNQRIRSISPTGEVGTLAGSGVAGADDSPPASLYPATTATFKNPLGLAIDSQGGLLVSEGQFAAIDGNNDLRRITRGAVRSVLAVSGLTSPGPVLATTNEPLLPGATYYYRAVTNNGRATVAGEIFSFVTPQSDIVVHNGSGLAPRLGPGAVIDFGTAPFSSPNERTFTIENIGGSALTISGVTLVAPASGGFQSTWNPGQSPVAPGGSATFTVTLMNAAAGTFADTLRITSNDLDQDTFEFTVTGKVLPPPVISNVLAESVTALGVTFKATVDPMGNPTEVLFEYSKNPDFAGALEVLTTAGSTLGFANGCGAEAKFNSPSGVAVDRFGNIFVADTMNHRIRRIAANGDCVVLAGTGVAGFADGAATVAQFNRPMGVAVDAAGNVFVADMRNHRIRKITPAGAVSTVAGFGTDGAYTDGVVSGARFSSPFGIAIDDTGNLFVADTGNGSVRKISSGGEVTTLRGNLFAGAVAVTRDGRIVVAGGETSPHHVIELSPLGAIVATHATGFFVPTGVAVDASNRIYVADNGNHRIARIEPGGAVVNIAGSGVPQQSGDNDGTGTTARFHSPRGLAVSPSGTVYVADTLNHRIRQINLAARRVVAASSLTTAPQNPVSLVLAGLEPDTTYYFRGIASNGGGTVYSPATAPYPTFTTLDNAAALVALTVNGTPVAGFNPCVYSYPQMQAFQASIFVAATAQSAGATIQLFEDGVYCCDLESGVPSGPITLAGGDHVLQLAVISADGTNSRAYTVPVSIPASPFSQWQSEKFGSDSGNEAIAGALANPDCDDAVNLLEYAFNLEPLTASSSGLPVVGRSGGFLTITYQRRLTASELTFKVEWSIDLEHWSDVGVTQQVLPQQGDPLTDDVLGKIPDPEYRKFIRVSVTLP